MLGERRAIQHRRRVPDPLPALDHGGAVTTDLTAPDPLPPDGACRRPSDCVGRASQARPPPLAGTERGAGGVRPATATVTLSVVVVSYNRRDLLARCLDAVLADPDVPDFELFVVDNDSHDGTRADGRRAVPERSADRQPRERRLSGEAHNQAFAAATGRYLLVLNQDIVVRPGALRALVEFAEAHPSCRRRWRPAGVRGRHVPALGVPVPGLEAGVLRVLRRLRAARQRDQRPLLARPVRAAVRGRAPAGRVPAAAPRSARAGRRRSTRPSSCTSRRRTSACGSERPAGRTLPAGRPGDARQRRPARRPPARRCRSSSTAARRSSTGGIAARAGTRC